VESKFYQADEHRAEKVRELFAAIAQRYDLLNDIMSLGLHRRWKRRLVELAGEPHDVLDLCCGTGDIAMRFRARVVGVDFTDEMLRVAATRGHPEIAWIRADALRLPFADNSFDAVSLGYGLRNLADIQLGLREILRVLRPGGKFVSLDFGKPESPVFRALYFGYLRIGLPILGRLFCGDPDTHGYILASLQNYPAQRGIKELMASQGWCGCDFEEFWRGSMAINYGSKPR
jgi:demethylmenaquinone methyltransferase/2-methoxy-6-polyprenyl-1,4-benzoquinol methylase